MKRRAIARLLATYALLVVAGMIGIHRWASLAPPAVLPPALDDGLDRRRLGRYLIVAGKPSPHGAPPYGAAVVHETVTGIGPLPITGLLFEVALVPGRDGVSATVDGRTAYATVDDLLSRQAYDHAHLAPDTGFGWGTHRAVVLAELAEALGIEPRELATRATFRRVRFTRRVVEPGSPPPAIPSRRPLVPWPDPITEQTLTRELVLDGVAEAATHLARSVGPDGAYRYLVDAPTNRTIPGYNWPRHAGTTFFLAQASALLDSAFIRHAALRAAAHLRDDMLNDCGARRCIAHDPAIADVGSSALAVIAFTELVRTGADASYRPAIVDLAAFLRSQQRADGELMHLYDREAGRPIDVQYLYYTGEAALALARAHAVTGDPADLDAARRALGRLSGAGWSFFGSRYHFSEEHWTCQAVAELWTRAPDPAALDFCSRWHGYQRRLQLDAGETPFDADGSFGFGPLVAPRLTPASSRGEAAGALLDVLLRETRAGRHDRDAEVAPVRRELGRAVAFVLRQQFHPGPSHLFSDPEAIRGAVPGSPVDWSLRIDYAQHAGSMMIRWLELDGMKPGGNQ